MMELAGLDLATSCVRSRHSIMCLRSMSPWLRAGTKRVRQLGHERARASTARAEETLIFQREIACLRPRVDARPSIVLPS